jgi:3'-5' exoribonuclease
MIINSIEKKEKYYNVKINDDFYKIWNNNPIISKLKLNLEIEILKSQNGTYGLVLEHFKIIKENEIGIQEDKRREMFKYILDKTKNEQIIEFLKENWEVIIKKPAARNHHHNYLGGLIQHTYEVVKEVEEVSQLAIDGAIIHDLGKIYEYDIDEQTGIIEYNDNFKEQLGLEKYSKIAPHILWVYNWCIEKGFKEIAHIVGSHHCFEEWGSIFKPNSEEAHAVFIADYKSSKDLCLTTKV